MHCSLLLQEHPEAWTRVDAILESSKNQQTKFFGLQVRPSAAALLPDVSAAHESCLSLHAHVRHLPGCCQLAAAAATTGLDIMAARVGLKLTACMCCGSSPVVALPLYGCCTASVYVQPVFWLLRSGP